VTAPATRELLPPIEGFAMSGDWTGGCLVATVDDPMTLGFGPEARCHHAGDPVQACDVPPLLATVRDRRALGVFVATSFFTASIHRRIREGGHPPA